MTYIPDPIERMEMRADDLAFEQFAGVPLGMIRCYGCKKIVPDGEVVTVTPNPDAPAYCSECEDGIAERIAFETERQ